MDTIIAFVAGGIIGAVMGWGLGYALYVLADNLLKMWGR